MAKTGFSLASWKSETKQDNQRDSERAEVVGWEATLFTGNTLALSSHVADSSTGGVGLLVADGAAIAKDIELILSINTGYRKFTRKAIVRWVDVSAGELRFGVQYIAHVSFVVV